MLRLILSPLVAAVIGGAAGYFGQCTTGACPLMSSWWGGACFGAAIGLLFAVPDKKR